MSLTVIKEGNVLRVLAASEEIPEGQVVELFTSDAAASERQAWLDAQMPSFIRGDEHELAEELFPVV